MHAVSRARISAAATAAALLVTLGGGTALAVDTPTDPGELTVIDTSEGKALADKDGNALYTWAGDERDKSNCTGDCARTWPAATGYPTKSSDVTGETNQIDLAGSDGRKQVVLEEKPLYYFKDDAKPGDTKGNGVKSADGKVWSLVGPDGKALGAAAAVPDTGDSPAASASPSASESPAGSASPDAGRSPSGDASASATGSPSASASASAGTGTATPTAPGVVPPVAPTDPGMSETPSGAVKAGAEEAEGEGASSGSVALALGALAAVAAAGTAFVVRRRRAGNH
ncbi:COG4315 family predicted lipoprotein [Streptomyces sp. CA-294286]|uniref:COG4315 family predicted lipoprotein n=1 Tax=Streptomyces sp. CA-294286 TaxID=3240070 RepID=UPI003D946854